MEKLTKKEWKQIEELIKILKNLEQQGLNIKQVIADSEREESTYKFTNEQKAILKKLELTTYANIQTRSTAADRLLEVIEVLEQNIPGISARLPKAPFRLGEIEEIQEVVKKEKLLVNQRMDISVLVTKAKMQSIGLDVDRCISIENILKLKKYGLLTDEQIEKYRKRQKEKVNGKAKTKVRKLIDILRVFEENGIDISELPKCNKKICEIDELRIIAEKENIDPNYDIGQNIGYVLAESKKKVVGEKTGLVIDDTEIEELRRYGILTDMNVEKYKKKLTGAQQAIEIAKKLRDRGIDLNELSKRDEEISKIDDIDGLQEAIEEEKIPEKYRIGKVLRSVLYAAKLKILSGDNQNDTNRKRKNVMRITDEEVETLKSWGLITEESMEKFKEAKDKNMNNYLASQAVAKVKQGDSKEIEEILRKAVAEQVGSNEQVRKELERLLLRGTMENIDIE